MCKRERGVILIKIKVRIPPPHVYILNWRWGIVTLR